VPCWVGILLLAVPIFAPIMVSLPWDGVFGLPGVAPHEVPLWFFPQSSCGCRGWCTVRASYSEVFRTDRGWQRVAALPT
jgi:hypothetical protein